MRGEEAVLVADGKWGRWNKAFAYDLFKQEMWKRAKSSGLAQYGKDSNNDDARPISFKTSPTWGGAWFAEDDSPPLVQEANSNYVEGIVYSQPDATPNKPKHYKSGYTVRENGGFCLQAYLNEPPKAQALKLIQWRLGVAGRGAIFQIRDGRPEFGWLSDLFNLEDLAALHVLWAKKDPTQAEEVQIADLENRLFDDFEGLTFDASTGKSDWYNNFWTLSFVVEPRGNVHIILENVDATVKGKKAVLDTGKEGILWEASFIDLFTAGGAFWFRSGKPRSGWSAVMEFGPHREGIFADSLGAAVFDKNATIHDGINTIHFEKFNYNVIDFGFRVTLTTTDRDFPPWIYGISVRLDPGERDATNDFDNPAFSTNDPYSPVNPNAPKIDGPVILDIEPSFDGTSFKRTAVVRVMDPMGLFSAGKPLPQDWIGKLSIDENPLLTGCVITSISQPGMRSLKGGTSTLFTAGADSELAFKCEDGWYLLAEYDCDPPPIGDGRRVGYHLRKILRTAGFKDWQIAGVNPNDGPIIKGAVLGKDWACRCDGKTKCADAIRTVLESYGFGWRFYQDRFGIWQFKKLDLTSKGTFTSTNAGLHSRLVIARPIDIDHNHGDVYNDYVTIGGEHGEIVHHMPGNFALLGRWRTKTLTNSGLRTLDECKYANLSMEWLYGRGGRRGTYETYFHDHFEPGHRIIADDGDWEIEALTGGSWARNEARYAVLEV